MDTNGNRRKFDPNNRAEIYAHPDPVDPDDPPAARFSKDPDAYRQGFKDGYTGRARNKRVYTTNVYCYQAGYLDGSLHRPGKILR